MEVSEKLRQISPSLTLAITSQAKALKNQGEDVINFAAGEPDFATPEHICRAAEKAIRDGKTRYTPAKGMPELIDAVREKFRRDNRLQFVPEEIIISSGAKYALYAAFQAICNPGDEVIIPSPYWVTYPEQVKLAGAVPVILETREEDEFRINRDRLSAAITARTKALIISSPANPTGAGLPLGDLEFIAEEASKNDFYVISDEIYEKLVFDGFEAVSIASLSDDIRKRSIVINGVSKSYAMTGWRVGYLAAPANIAKAIASYQSHTTSNPSTISQYAALAALAGDQNCVEEMRKAYQERRDLMMEWFARLPEISCVKPVGTFYTFPNISGLGKTSIELARELLEKALLAVVPGVAFGADTNLRMSFADSPENLEKGLRRLDKYISTIK